MIKCIRYSLLVISAAVAVIGGVRGIFNITLIGVLLLFLHNVLFSFERIRRRIIFLFFNGTSFVFLICRPVIDMFRGDIWWRNFSSESVWFALTALYLTLLFLFAGALLAERYVRRSDEKKGRLRKERPLPGLSRLQRDARREQFLYCLRIVSLVMFYLSMVCFMMVEMEKLVFMSGREYVEYYTSFQTQMPAVIRAFDTMMKYFLCIFLATMPSKSMTFIPLCLYFLSAVPSLLIGIRNPIVLNAIFIFLYYFLRDVRENSKKWLGYGEKVFIILMAPAAILFLGAYNYIREGSAVAVEGVIGLVLDFLRKQGVSFNVLCIAYDSMPKVRSFGAGNYTFGDFTDYFLHNDLVEGLLGLPSLGTGNNVVSATQGHSFSHAMSYAALGDSYLEGHGYGSSFILELFYDYGWLGVVLGALIFGFVTILLVRLFQKGWVSGTIALATMTSLFFVPRASAASWIVFIVTAQFLLAMIFSYVMAQLCVKSYTPLVSRSLRVKRLT